MLGATDQPSCWVSLYWLYLDAGELDRSLGFWMAGLSFKILDKEVGDSDNDLPPTVLVPALLSSSSKLFFAANSLAIWPKIIKTFHTRNLRIFLIS
jgi:hypothetical protein